MPDSAAPPSYLPHGQGFTLPRRCRLKSPQTIRNISLQPDGRKQTGIIRVAWKSREPGDTARFAFVVSRHSGRAHTRNRIKRRMRAAVRAVKADWPAETDVVLSAYGDRIAREEFDALCGIVERIFRHIRQATDGTQSGDTACA